MYQALSRFTVLQAMGEAGWGPGNEARVSLETELVHIGFCTIVLCFVGLTYGGIEILLTVFQMDCADLLQVNTEIYMDLAYIHLKPKL